MNAMAKRVRALESVGCADLSPAVKAWLGQPLTDAEREALDSEHIPTAINTSGFSKELKAWLGVE